MKNYLWSSFLIIIKVIPIGLLLFSDRLEQTDRQTNFKIFRGYIYIDLSFKFKFIGKFKIKDYYSFYMLYL